MLNERVIFFIILTVVCAFPLHAEWEAVGPYGGFLRCLEIDPLNPAVLYTASYDTPSKIFKSTHFNSPLRNI